jgi:DNA uptake protein ComE-like DNA-binding protein
MKKNTRWARLVVAVVVAFVAAGPLAAAGPLDTKAADTKTTAKKTDAKAELVDINTATEAELIALPAIGKAYAKKIIAGRPYARKDELVSKNIMPESSYVKVKDKIIAKQK